MPARYLNGLPLAVCSRRAHNSLPSQEQGASSDSSDSVMICPTSGELAQITWAPVSDRSTSSPASRLIFTFGVGLKTWRVAGFSAGFSARLDGGDGLASS